ncbi:helix-turn-helix domain-containing protein [Streptomyces sp. NPDC026672]|uniref:TetR/AcrR family transcriptional regulator n=1 Tax=unclassified Streptomyces TaxID=2593676 RepID=UPI0034000251
MPKRETYHHGDLKAALVDAALALIAEGGVGAVSIAEVARRAGVSSGAPYRHFPNRQTLLAATATTVARRLTRRLRAAESEAAGDGRARDPIEASAAAAAEYARFTAQHGAGFDLIFAEELRDLGDEELIDAGRGLIDTLLPAVLSVTRGDAAAAVQLLERQVAAAHGYALLLRSGFLSGRKASIDDIAENATVLARSVAESTANATT